MRILVPALVPALALAACLASGCTSPPPPAAWETRLRGDAVVLLGEVHDNGEQHRQRLAVLRRAIAAGWRPAIVMEQFDRERQPEIERARRERPGDAQHLIDLAAPAPARAGSGWNWAFYRPFVALALEFDLPLLAGNLSNADTTKIVRGGYAAVFDPPAIAALRLDRPIAPAWQAAQEHEIDEGHCHALPASLWPKMARAQFARDAVMADMLGGQAARGVVLLAGNGHVRRDIGVPQWAAGDWQPRLLAVGWLEDGFEPGLAAAFDAVVATAPAPREDPCEGFKARRPTPPASGAAS